MKQHWFIVFHCGHRVYHLTQSALVKFQKRSDQYTTATTGCPFSTRELPSLALPQVSIVSHAPLQLTSEGIGEALAERFIAEGSFVIAVGRRKDRLEAFVHKHGHDKAQAVPLDITKLDSIPAFVTNITNTYSNLDCVVLNSGMQRKCNFGEPESVDVDMIQTELLTNYTAQLALTKALLPFFKAKRSPCALVYMSSGLAMVPIPGISNYCGTKAALHQWILCLRENLKDTDVNVIEVFPPAVQTELHDVNPDIKNGRAMGMPLDEFTNEVSQDSCFDFVLICVRHTMDLNRAWNKYRLALQRIHSMLSN